MNIAKSSWRKIKLGDIAVKHEVVERNPFENGIKKFIKVEHLDSDSLHINRWGDLHNQEIPPTFYKKFFKGQVLFPTRNPHLRRAALASFEGICGEKTLTLSADESQIDNKLFPFIFQSDSFINHCIRSIVGSTNPHVRWRDVANYEFYLPELKGQVELSKLLWSIDNTLQKYKKLKSELQRYKESYIFNNYQDEKYRLQSFSTLFEVNPAKTKNLDNNEDVAFIAMENISEDGKIIERQIRKISEVNKGYKYFENGDILFAKITPCMENGKGALAEGLTNGKGFGSTEFHILRPYEANDRYFIYHLTQARFFRKFAEARMTGSAGQKRVPSNFFDSYNFSIPSLEQRKKIGQAANNVQYTIDNLSITIDNIIKINKMILNKIF